MTSHLRSISGLGAVAAVFAMSLALASCDEADGPAEQLGERVDGAVEQTGDADRQRGRRRRACYRLTQGGGGALCGPSAPPERG